MRVNKLLRSLANTVGIVVAFLARRSVPVRSLDVNI
jgi:hypothetical protein